jgi:hypothetical protein
LSVPLVPESDYALGWVVGVFWRPHEALLSEVSAGWIAGMRYEVHGVTKLVKQYCHEVIGRLSRVLPEVVDRTVKAVEGYRCPFYFIRKVD